MSLNKKHPNIIFIVADDMGYGDLGAYGNEIIHTPHLNRLVREGVSLTQHYSASPMCAPARACILTGRYNHRTGAVDVPSNRGLDRIALNETTIADAFKNAGYNTGMIGKWHTGAHDMLYHPNSRGFSEFVGFLNGGMDYYKWVLDYNGTSHRYDGRYLTDVFTEESVQFIKRHQNEPFFLHLAYNAPHAPFQVPEDEIKRYNKYCELTNVVKKIYAMITRMDNGIGRIMETLDKLNLDKNTIIIFTSDNGPWFGGPAGNNPARRFNGHFSGHKGDVLEGGIRVPALLRCPDMFPSGFQFNDMMHFVDWFPSLLTIAGIDQHDGLPLDGWDISSLLRGEKGTVPAIRFWQWNRYEPIAHCNAATRDGKWKLYWPPVDGSKRKEPGDSEWYRIGLTEPHRLMEIDTGSINRKTSSPRPPLLFDLSIDPYEKTDLSSQYPDRVHAMKQKWDAWFESVDAERRNAWIRNGVKNVEN